MSREVLNGLDLKSPLLLTGSAGNSGQVLTSQGAGATPIWSTVSGGTVIADRTLLDDISSGFNGSAVTFNLTVSASPYSPGSALGLEVVLGGVQQRPTTDYTVSGSTITFTSAPVSGLTCLIIGWVASSSLAAVATSGSANDVSGLTEAAQDAAASLFTTGSHTGISFAYDDAGNRINATAVTGVASPLSDSTVSYLFHFEGANNSTTFTDTSSYTRAATPTGAPVISTAQSKIGSSSLYLDGSSYLTLDGTDGRLTPGTGDFTIEGWFYTTSNATYRGVFGNTGSDIFRLFLNLSSSFLVLRINSSEYKTGTNSTASGTALPLSLNTWYHIAVCRSAGTFKLYLDGTLHITVTEQGAFNINTPVNKLGVATGTSAFSGYLDEFRFKLGVAVYTADFTPATSPFPNSGAGSLPSPATTGQTYTDGEYLYVCVAGGSPGTWQRVPVTSDGKIPSAYFSGLAASATTDTTNATNISTGTLAAARLPSVNLGTTAVDLTRASGALSLTGVSIDGSAGSVDWANVSGKPTAVSAFTNDANYITSAGAPVQSVAGKTGAVTLAKADVGLGSVENTALSTWAGSTNITTIGTLAQTLRTVAGTASAAPVLMASGTNLSAAAAGAIEYDGTYFYATPTTTSGRGHLVPRQTFRLTGAGSNLGPTIADFFGATSSINLAASSVYEIEILAYLLKNTAGTITWTLTASSAPTLITGTYWGSPVTGIAAGAPITGYAGSRAATTAAFAATASVSNNAYMTFRFAVQVVTNLATNFRLQVTSSAGTVTPQAGSFYTVRQVSGSTGSFA